MSPVGKTQLKFKQKRLDAPKLTKSYERYQLGQLQGSAQQQLATTMVSDQQYQALTQPEQRLTVFVTKDVVANQAALKKLAASQQKRDHALQGQVLGGRYSGYQMVNGMYSGLEFMGFFLGIAFLAMLASCLMFKILSGAAAVQHRYVMLEKIGTRTSELNNALRKEIAVLFILPGIVGVVHVLFGLKMFSFIMIGSPYTGIWLPFLIFAGLYLIYYLITVQIYRRIVLQ